MNRAQSLRPLLSDLAFLLVLAAFLGCLHHALRSDRPLFTAPRNPGYASLLSIAAPELRALLGTPGVVLLDARTETAFAKGTIPTSLSLPLHSEIEEDLLRTVQQASRVIVFCSDHNCNASKELGVILKERGAASVEVYPGGYEEWVRLGFPVRTGQ
jgi:rhodanese-related sulfurtransferase